MCNLKIIIILIVLSYGGSVIFQQKHVMCTDQKRVIDISISIILFLKIISFILFI